MRNYHALAFLLLLSASWAEFTLYLSPESSAFAISAEKTSFAGHFGNYTVQIGVFPYPSYVTVSGEGADAGALAREVAWMRENGLLETGCDLSGLENYRQTAYCDESGRLVICSFAPGCPLYSGKAAPEEAGAMETLALPSPAPAMQRATDIGARGKASEGGVGPEQILPLVAAFLAVIVASYLILQQRQIQIPIGPQEERLLENETRAGIMQELSLADKIPTDLSSRLGKSKATIVEHLETLLQAGFVEKLETPGKKFVFYRLTRKGRQALLRQAG